MKVDVDFCKEKLRYEFVFDLEDGRHSAYFISLAMLNNNPSLSCYSFKELFNRMFRLDTNATPSNT